MTKSKRRKLFHKLEQLHWQERAILAKLSEDCPAMRSIYEEREEWAEMRRGLRRELLNQGGPCEGCENGCTQEADAA